MWEFRVPRLKWHWNMLVNWGTFQHPSKRLYSFISLEFNPRLCLHTVYLAALLFNMIDVAWASPKACITWTRNWFHQRQILLVRGWPLLKHWRVLRQSPAWEAGFRKVQCKNVAVIIPFLILVQIVDTRNARGGFTKWNQCKSTPLIANQTFQPIIAQLRCLPCDCVAHPLRKSVSALA